MIVPIGHEESAVRRQPWIVYGVLLLCFAVHLAMPAPRFVATDDDREVALEDAVLFWLEHRYLTLDPALAEAAGEQLPEYRSMLKREAADDLYVPDDDLVAMQQAELDESAAWALEMHRSVEQAGPDVYARFGLVPSKVSAVGLIAHMFMHGGWLHLLGNLFMLFIAGPALEDRWGRPLFASFYLLAGLFAGAAFIGANWGASMPMVGASGAISGIFGAFLVRFWSTRIRFAYLFMAGLRVVRGTFWAPAKLMLPLWLVNEVFQAWFSSEMGYDTGVAYSAHIGGFLFGVATASAIRWTEIEEKYIHGAIEDKVTLQVAHPAIEEALEARQRGENAEAMMLLERAVGENPTDPDLVVAYWDAAVATGRGRDAAPAVIALVRGELERGQHDEALRHWIEMTDAEPGALADPATLMRLAPILAERGDRPRAVLALRHAVDPENRGLTAGFALRAIDLARELDPHTAVCAIEMALALGDLHETKREKLERLADELRAEARDAEPTPEVPVQREREEAAPVDPFAPPQVAPVSAAAERAPIEIESDELPDPRTVRARAEQEERERGPMALSLSGDLESDLEAGPEGLAAPDPDLALAAPPPIPTAAPATPPPLPTLASEPPALPPATPPALPSATPPALPPVEPPSAPPSASPSIEDAAPRTTGESAPPLEAELLLDGRDLEALGDLAALPRFQDLKIVEALPRGLSEHGVELQTAAGRKVRIEYAQIQAVAVAAVRGLSAKPVVLIDLLLDWNELEGGILRVVRLRTDAFDPRQLTPEASTAVEAVQQYLAQVYARTGATPLPSADEGQALRFARFEDLAHYQREVLQVDG